MSIHSLPQSAPQSFLGGVDHSGISGSELRRVIVEPILDRQRAAVACTHPSHRDNVARWDHCIFCAHAADEHGSGVFDG